MLIYVSHCYGGNPKNLERAKDMTHALQIADLDNTYICPLLALSHIGYGEIGYAAEMEACIDLLSVCDKMIVASDISEGVHKEMDFAQLVGMEVKHIGC